MTFAAIAAPWGSPTLSAPPQIPLPRPWKWNPSGTELAWNAMRAATRGALRGDSPSPPVRRRVLPLSSRRVDRARLDAALNTEGAFACVVRLHCCPPHMEGESIEDRACFENSARAFRVWGASPPPSAFLEVESRMAVSLVATQCVLVLGMVFESPDFRSIEIMAPSFHHLIE